MNHREIEYHAKMRWEQKEPSFCSFFPENVRERLKTLTDWYQETSRNVFQEDLLLDYGYDCLCMYLFFENTPKADDPDLDSWEECSLEGLYKFLGKYRRIIMTAVAANKESYYQNFDPTTCFDTIMQMRSRQCLIF